MVQIYGESASHPPNVNWPNKTRASVCYFWPRTIVIINILLITSPVINSVVFIGSVNNAEIVRVKRANWVKWKYFSHTYSSIYGRRKVAAAIKILFPIF